MTTQNLFSIDEKITDIISHGNPTLGPKLCDILVMPLQFIFKSVFEIPGLLNETLKNIQTSLSDNNINSFANGKIFKNIVQQLHPAKVIPYILYLDDFQINNPLGTHTYIFYLWLLYKFSLNSKTFSFTTSVNFSCSFYIYK